MTDTPDRTLGFLLHDVARLLRKRFEQNARARGFGLTRSQWQVLAMLVRNEGIHQGGLAELLDIEPITLARILDRLEEAGLVERHLDAQDRRVRVLRLTPGATPVLQEMRTLGAATREEAFAGIPAEDRQKLMQTLSAMKENLTRTSAGTAAAASEVSHA